LDTGGGVSSYFNAIKNYLPKRSFFLEIGSGDEKENIFSKIWRVHRDRNRLKELLSCEGLDFDLVHINPSFVYGSLIRDGQLLMISKHLGKKTLVFFRGWEENHVPFVDKFFFRLFFSIYRRADAFVVLSSDIKAQLRRWGFKQPIHLETTSVANELLSDFSLAKRLDKIDRCRKIRLLFLSRIEKRKGICETIEAVRNLSEKNLDLHLFVAGEGPFLNFARQFAKNAGIANKVSFLGFVKGEAKKAIFTNSDIYIFPTYYGEGMPNSVLEAMAFGLPVLTRPVGGLRDFFLNGQHGFITDSKAPATFASFVEKIFLDKALWKKISVNNHEYAQQRFMADVVAKRLQAIYNATIQY